LAAVGSLPPRSLGREPPKVLTTHDVEVMAIAGVHAVRAGPCLAHCF